MYYSCKMTQTLRHDRLAYASGKCGSSTGKAMTRSSAVGGAARAGSRMLVSTPHSSRAVHGGVVSMMPISAHEMVASSRTTCYMPCNRKSWLA